MAGASSPGMQTSNPWKPALRKVAEASNDAGRPRLRRPRQAVPHGKPGLDEAEPANRLPYQKPVTVLLSVDLQNARVRLSRSAGRPLPPAFA